MSPAVIKLAVRARFKTTSRDKAITIIEEEANTSVTLVRALPDEEARTRSIRVPEMRGVDEEMQDWSACQVLEHNTIVHHSMTDIFRHLATGSERTVNINPKTDVLPGPVDESAILRFEDSIGDFLSAVEETTDTDLKATPTVDHPLFGPLTAHGWMCMLGLHLELHRAQLEAIATELG